MCVSSACLSLSANYYLPACSLSRRSLLLLAVCRRPSPLQAPVDSWSTSLLLQLLLLSASTALPLPARLRHCPALPGFVGSHLPRQRIHSLTSAFRPALPHPVSQSVKSLSVARQLSVCPLLDQAATSAPPPRQSHQLAQALISPPCCRLFCSLAAAATACDLLDLAASATVSAPSPCDAAANNNATASDQPFACGRPIHLATSSPNKRADYCSSLV